MDGNQLRQVPLFEGMSDEDLDSCGELFEKEDFLAGSGFAREGEFAYKFFVVLDGEADVLHDFEPVARLGPGEFFGEMGLLTGERRNARVVAHTRCEIAWMMSWNFDKMTEQHPELAQRIDAEVARRTA